MELDRGSVSRPVSRLRLFLLKVCTLGAACWLAAVLLLLSCRWLPGAFVPGLIALGGPLLFAFGIPLLVVCAALRLRVAWPVLIFWLLGLNSLLPLYWGWHRDSPGELSIVSFNVNYFEGDLKGRPVASNIEATQPMLLAARPDILCLQDYSTDSAGHNALIHSFNSVKLGLGYSMQKTPGLATYSRYPIRGYQAEYFPDSENSFSWVDVLVNGRTLRVFNLHLESYALGFAKTVPDALGRLKHGLQRRAQQADRVAECVASSPHPVVLCGDFNDVPPSYAYSRVSAGLVDGFRQAGRGFAWTYEGALPLLRIDYILASPSLRFGTYGAVKGPPFLDHCMVGCRLYWR
jgi:endonuclease/exonuclease/phosphatase family metal-dependent hydrolase